MCASVSSSPSASSELLTKLKLKQWQSVIEHVRANPSDAKHVVASRSSLLPLHVACENGAPIQVIKAFLQANPKAVEIKSGIHERLPIHCLLSSASISESIVSLLVEAYPGACRVADKNGNLPIHLICQAPNITDGIFTSILSMYPEGAYVKSLAGNYPLHLAAANKDVPTRKIALAALDRGTLYANISKMTSIRLSKEHEARTKALEECQAEKLSKMEATAKDERTKLNSQINTLKLQLNTEKEGNVKLQEDIKALNVTHEENLNIAIKKEQAKASKMESEIRSDLAEVQLKNMDLLEQLEVVQSELDTSNEKVEKQANTIVNLESKLEDTTKTLDEMTDELESTSKELKDTQEQLNSVRTINDDKSKYILHLESSLKEARESVLALVHEQEHMKASMVSQKEALAAILLGHDTTMNDAGELANKMVNLASDIEGATGANKQGESQNAGQWRVLW